MDLALNNLQRLICHKTKQTKPELITHEDQQHSNYLCFVSDMFEFPPLPCSTHIINQTKKKKLWLERVNKSFENRIKKCTLFVLQLKKKKSQKFSFGKNDSL